jgi:FtsH-binding integral membrane protein
MLSFARATACGQAPKTMTKNTKIYLIASLALAVIGGVALLTKLTPLLYVAFPVGAVFFGLFLVSAFLGREAEQFSKEQHPHEHKAGKA